MNPYFEAAGIRIFLGDVREIVPTLGLRFDAVIADPPYQQTSLPWDTWPTGWPSIVADVSSSLWCFGSFRMFTDRWAEFAPWSLSQDLVWEKHNGSSFHADRFRRVHEQAVHFYRGSWDGIYKSVPQTHDATARSVRRKTRPAHMGHIDSTPYESHDGGPRQMRSVIYARSMHGMAENETQKPEGIVGPLIEYACPKGGLLLSAFSGSGTDLVSARMMGIRAIGIDVREDQCEKAAKRLGRSLPLEMVG
jgi:site-specific DNA-methyltransferase (adenine-specific)